MGHGEIQDRSEANPVGGGPPASGRWAFSSDGGSS